MGIEEKVDGEEVTEQEFALAISDMLKAYQKQRYNIMQKELAIAEMVRDVGMYRSLDFKLKYFWDEKEQQYYFSYNTKDKPGFTTSPFPKMNLESPGK